MIKPLPRAGRYSMDLFLYFARDFLLHMSFCQFSTCSCPRLATRLRAVPAQYIIIMCFIKACFKAINAMITSRKYQKRGCMGGRGCVQNRLCKSYAITIVHTTSQNIQFLHLLPYTKQLSPSNSHRSTEHHLCPPASNSLWSQESEQTPRSEGR